MWQTDRRTDRFMAVTSQRGAARETWPNWRCRIIGSHEDKINDRVIVVLGVSFKSVRHSARTLNDITSARHPLCCSRLDVSSSAITYISANTSTRLIAMQSSVTFPRQIWRLRPYGLGYAVSQFLCNADISLPHQLPKGPPCSTVTNRGNDQTKTFPLGLCSNLAICAALLSSRRERP